MSTIPRGAARASTTDTADTTDPRVGIVTQQEEVVRSPLARKLLAGLRIVLGFTFLWAFVDKLFGLGYATPGPKAWINGGTPAQGFMKHAEGPFGSFFANIAGPWADWLFMAGLAGIGVALIAGAGLKIAAITGTLLLAMMYLAEFPLGATGMTNPLVDSHWIEALGICVVAATLAGDTWGLGRWWGR
ncbi:MAG: DoxX family protein, partial [Humibacillus sp.]|nr:DoxX family protein [Humibacillus sp.]